MASGCQMEKPWLNLPLCWEPHSSLGVHQAGTAHTHTNRNRNLPWGCSSQPWQSRDSLPHTMGTSPGSHLAPAMGAWRSPAHRAHLSLQQALPCPRQELLGTDSPAPALPPNFPTGSGFSLPFWP